MTAFYFNKELHELDICGPIKLKCFFNYKMSHLCCSGRLFSIRGNQNIIFVAKNNTQPVALNHLKNTKIFFHYFTSRSQNMATFIMVMYLVGSITQPLGCTMFLLQVIDDIGMCLIILKRAIFELIYHANSLQVRCINHRTAVHILFTGFLRNRL